MGSPLKFTRTSLLRQALYFASILLFMFKDFFLNIYITSTYLFRYYLNLLFNFPLEILKNTTQYLVLFSSSLLRQRSYYHRAKSNKNKICKFATARHIFANSLQCFGPNNVQIFTYLVALFLLETFHYDSRKVHKRLSFRRICSTKCVPNCYWRQNQLSVEFKVLLLVVVIL